MLSSFKSRARAEMVGGNYRADYRGFDDESVRAQTVGLGLVGITERAALVGGRAGIISSPGKGTTIEVVLPLALRHE